MLDSPAEYTLSALLHHRGGEDYVNKFCRRWNLVDIKTVGEEDPDPLTLRVTLHDPVPFILDLMSYTPFYPLNEKSMEPFKQVGSQGRARVTYDQKFTRPPMGVVTNGRVTFSRSGISSVACGWEPNPYYWDKRSREVQQHPDGCRGRSS